MMRLANLLRDVDGTLGRRSGEDRARTLRRITDLFTTGANGFTPEQIDLFDAVIQRFATAIETRARIELAERLAKLDRAPPGVILWLANDEIVVARPVLSSSPCLDDQALMSIALTKGRDHMLAICDRPSVSPSVTDMLIAQGDGVVRHAIAGNAGARFSRSGSATLIEHARSDPALGELLGERADLSPFETRQLVEIAKEYARDRLLASLPGAEREVAGAVERSASSLSGPNSPRSYESALTSVQAMLDRGELSEGYLARMAGEGRLEETISAVASMTGLSVACIDRIFDERDNDLLIVIGKARGWTWRTVRALLKLRNPGLSERHHFRRAEETFDSLASATAGRVLHFLKVRETTGHRREHARSDRVRV